MVRKSILLGAFLLAGASVGAVDSVSAAPFSAAGSVVSQQADSSNLILKTQVRRRVAPTRVAPGRVAPGRGGGFRRGGGGINPGAAVGIGAAAAVLGIMGAAAAANAQPAAPVYGRCYFVRQRVYDDWGNYMGRRRVRVCD